MKFSAASPDGWHIDWSETKRCQKSRKISQNVRNTIHRTNPLAHATAPFELGLHSFFESLWVEIASRFVQDRQILPLPRGSSDDGLPPKRTRGVLRVYRPK
jgi:hypothetical protein